MTPVKNQFNCGACWAFSTVATVESMYAIKTQELKEFSVQQVKITNYHRKVAKCHVNYHSYYEIFLGYRLCKKW